MVCTATNHLLKVSRGANAHYCYRLRRYLFNNTQLLTLVLKDEINGNIHIANNVSSHKYTFNLRSQVIHNVSIMYSI